MVKTPAEKWKEAIINYRKKCQKIMKVSKNVRYSGVINAYGRTLTGIVRPGITPLLKSEQIKNEFFILSTLMNLRKGVSNVVGKLNYVLLEHQKVSIVIFQKNDMTFYVSIDRKSKDVKLIISKIKKLI
jgi:hypothetical protein